MNYGQLIGSRVVLLNEDCKEFIQAAENSESWYPVDENDIRIAEKVVEVTNYLLGLSK